jgi:hypothetical protein
MEPSKQLVDALYRDQVLRARRMAPEEKLFAGIALFERACQVMIAGIRDEFPDADDKEVLRILKARLAQVRALEWGP